MKKISFVALRNSLAVLPKRFPEAMCFLVLLVVWCIMRSWNLIDFVDYEWRRHEEAIIHLTDIQSGTIIYYLTVAFLLSLVLRLWGEEVKDNRKVWIASIVGHLLLIIDAIYLWNLPKGSVSSEMLIAHGSFCTALVIGGVFLPFFREKNDVASWNFAVRMFFFAILCPFACAVVYGALALLIHSFDALFGIKVADEWYGTIASILCLGIAVSLWMSRIPQGEAKFNREVFTFKFIVGLIRYLFLPIVALYLVVLYFYGLKILIAMELPKGGVCYLIHVLMVGCLAIEVLLYPQIQAGAKPFEQKLVRWLPVAILPLLVLMTVAIGRRFFDYGITVNRLYTITLNLWYYGVCIGLWLTNCRRINWISLSFAALYLLTSALPINYCTISRDYVLNRIERTFAAFSEAVLPLQYNAYDEFMKSLPNEDAESLRNDLWYVKNLYNQDYISRFIDKDVNLWQSYKKEDDEGLSTLNIRFRKKDNIVVPDGYSSFRECKVWRHVDPNDSTIWHITAQDSLIFTIDLDKIKDMDLDTVKDLSLPEDSCKGLWVISELDIKPNWNDETELDIMGYFFEK